jgi:hypothetical protein
MDLPGPERTLLLDSAMEQLLDALRLKAFDCDAVDHRNWRKAITGAQKFLARVRVGNDILRRIYHALL